MFVAGGIDVGLVFVISFELDVVDLADLLILSSMSIAEASVA